MRYVTLQPREISFPSLPPVPLPGDEEVAKFTQGLTLRESLAIDVMAAQLLSRLGLHRVRVGGRYYQAAERRVIADIQCLELDLGEIADQIEEMRREHGDLVPSHQPNHNQRTFQMATKTKAPKEAKTFTPTKLAPQTGPREFRGSMFRDEGARPAPKKEENRVEIKMMSDEALNRFAATLTLKEKEAVAEMIRNEMQRLGFPHNTRPGGSIWLKARASVLSGLRQFEVDIMETRGDMEGNGVKFDGGSEGVFLKPDTD